MVDKDCDSIIYVFTDSSSRRKSKTWDVLPLRWNVVRVQQGKSGAGKARETAGGRCRCFRARKIALQPLRRFPSAI